MSFLPGSTRPQSVSGNRPFLRPSFELQSPLSASDGKAIRSLPDLIAFNAEFNPDHTFALQEERKGGCFTGFARITFDKLYKVVKEGTKWVENAVLRAASKQAVEPCQTQRAVALFLESDLTLFVYLCALLHMNIPVVLLSARLSAPALTHLLAETSARAIICSTRTEKPAVEAVRSLAQREKAPTIVIAASYQVLIESCSGKINIASERAFTYKTPFEDLPGSLILHSSGTTGLPKPVPLTHRYLLGYAACHRLEPEEAEGRLNVSTLPLYHGFGLLAPCLSLSVGKTCCLPSSAVIPAAESTTKLLKTTGACSLMTVPTILEDMADSSVQSYLDALASLDFVAIGGGALKPQVGEFLTTTGIKLLNHYGVTEIGAIAYICVPDETYDWHYLRLRTDLGLELNEVKENGKATGLFRLVGHPFGSEHPLEIQDLLECNPSDRHMEVRVLGRTDDLIVLATGEKVLPQAVEASLNRTDFIKAAMVFGEHRNEVGVLVEPEDRFASHEHQSFVEAVWSIIQEINKSLDGHARIASRDFILVKPAHKAIPRSDKGSIMRKEAYNTFFQEISAVYENLEKLTANQERVFLDERNLEASLEALVQSCFQDRVSPAFWSITDDLFELGMDSLEATRLSRRLGTVANISRFPGIIPGMSRPDFVYRHPTVSRLAAAIKEGGINTRIKNNVTRIRLMETTREKYMFTPVCLEPFKQREALVVVLTGSTGSLGTNVLAKLARNRRIEHIICINRHSIRGKGVSRYGPAGKQHQMAANARQGVIFQEHLWAKIEFLQADTHAANLGLDLQVYERIGSQVTHILHNAWPMDFQRGLESLESQVQVVKNLLDFAQRAFTLQQTIKPKLLFLSSIAVAGRYSGKMLAEAPVEDPCSTVPMGYAEAKWVCEQILMSAAKLAGDCFEPVIVRIGQLTGSSISGYWNPTEHFPVLLRASKLIGALPDLQGSFSWLPVDIAAQAVLDVLLIGRSGNLFYHVENPIRQPWPELIQYLGYKLRLPECVPFDEWIRRTRADENTSFVAPLQNFLLDDFRRLSGGGLVLGTQQSRRASPTMRSCGGVGLALVDRYIESWEQHGILAR